MSEFHWTYQLIYFVLLDDLVWIICNLSISQESFGYSFLHKVYSEYRVWYFDNIHFRKIHFLAQQCSLASRKIIVRIKDSQGPSANNLRHTLAAFWSFMVVGAPIIFFSFWRKLENWFSIRIEELPVLPLAKNRPFRAIFWNIPSQISTNLESK